MDDRYRAAEGHAWTRTGKGVSVRDRGVGLSATTLYRSEYLGWSGRLGLGAQGYEEANAPAISLSRYDVIWGGGCSWDDDGKELLAEDMGDGQCAGIHRIPWDCNVFYLKRSPPMGLECYMLQR